MENISRTLTVSGCYNLVNIAYIRSIEVSLMYDIDVWSINYDMRTISTVLRKCFVKPDYGYKDCIKMSWLHCYYKNNGFDCYGRRL